MTDYQTPFADPFKVPCASDTEHAPECPGIHHDGTWLGVAQRATESLRQTLAALRVLCDGGMTTTGPAVSALREEARRLADVVTVCLDNDADPAAPAPKGQHQ